MSAAPSDRGMFGSNMKILEGSCFNHLCNVWIGAIEILLSRKITQILVKELALIPPQLHVKCNIIDVLTRSSTLPQTTSRVMVMHFMIG